jgi:hypothetical protein
MIENKVEPKLRNYTDNTPYLPPLLPNNKLLDDKSSFNSFQKVKAYNEFSLTPNQTKSPLSKKQEYSSVLLDRQMSPQIFNTSLDIESDLIKPLDCTVSQRINYSMDNVFGLGNKMYSSFDNNNNNNDNISLKNAYDLLISEDEHLKLSQKFKQSCGQKKKTLDYSDYQTPPRKTEGYGFGNPSDYNKTYVGKDTRAYTDQNAREVDIFERSITPIDGLRINYSNLPYEWETREGITTRNYKKMITNFN